MTLSIIICTYNRSRLLEKCLHSLVDQIVGGVEVIVIDNNSIDNTKKIVETFQNQINILTYQLESEVGLSHARNRGMIEAKGEWVLYLDDDGIAFDDMVERALYLCNLNQYDCVGGMYYGYYEGKKPRWVIDDFGTKHKYSESLSSCPYTIPCGGIVLYRMSLLKALNGFSTEFGMSGDKKTLGEETELQFRAQQNNYTIGFDPNLKIQHLVKAEYTKLSWFLKSAYLEGLASESIQIKSNKVQLLINYVKSIGGLIAIRLPYSFYKLITKKKYYWQNMIYDSLMPNFLFTGKLIAHFKKNHY